MAVKFKTIFLRTEQEEVLCDARFSPVFTLFFPPTPFSPTGGYYLTSVYASLHLIQSLDKEQPFSGCLTPEVQEALKEWSCRRSREAQRQKENQQSQVGAACFDCSSAQALVALHVGLLWSNVVYSLHTNLSCVKW